MNFENAANCGRDFLTLKKLVHTAIFALSSALLGAFFGHMILCMSFRFGPGHQQVLWEVPHGNSR